MLSLFPRLLGFAGCPRLLAAGQGVVKALGAAKARDFAWGAPAGGSCLEGLAPPLRRRQKPWLGPGRVWDPRCKGQDSASPPGSPAPAGWAARPALRQGARQPPTQRAGGRVWAGRSCPRGLAAPRASGSPRLPGATKKGGKTEEGESSVPSCPGHLPHPPAA